MGSTSRGEDEQWADMLSDFELDAIDIFIIHIVLGTVD